MYIILVSTEINLVDQNHFEMSFKLVDKTRNFAGPNKRTRDRNAKHGRLNNKTNIVLDDQINSKKLDVRKGFTERVNRQLNMALRKADILVFTYDVLEPFRTHFMILEPAEDSHIRGTTRSVSTFQAQHLTTK